MKRGNVTRIKWCLKQLFPLLYASVYYEGEKHIACIWQMWLGRCFNVRSFELKY